MVGDGPEAGALSGLRVAPHPPHRAGAPDGGRAPTATAGEDRPRAVDPEAQQKAAELRALGEEVAAAPRVRVFDPKERYKAGEIIVHAEYGRGKIENVLRSSLLVRFPIGGLKSLMLLELERARYFASISSRKRLSRPSTIRLRLAAS